MLNYYQVLDIHDFANEDEVRTAYRRKCRQYHPDLVNNMGPKISSLAQREMAFINKAYEVLGARDRRSQYDAWLREADGSDILRTCRLCGINFTLDEEHSEHGLCPLCFEEYRENERDAASRGRGADMESLLRTCFAILHHFASAMVLRKFTPILNLIVCGERLKVTGSPGPAEITVFNRRIYDQSKVGIAEKQPWNSVYKMGRLTFGEANPAQAAGLIVKFLNGAFENPWLEYARITIEDEDFKSYEHVLNQSVLVVAGQISPWTASKLYTRHHTNLVKALNDPDALVPDPFFSVMSQAGPARLENGDASKLKKENEKLRRELEAERRRGNVQNDIDTAKNKDVIESERRKYEDHIQRQRRRLEEKHDRERNDLENRMRGENERIEKEADDNLRREKSRAQLKKQLLENELSAVRGELEEQAQELFRERAMITHLNARILEITRKSVDAFETYAEFAPEISPENIQPADLSFLIQNMAHEIQLLRAGAQGETRALETEFETARERVNELETRLEREAETLRRVRDTVEQHRRRAVDIVRRHREFAPDVAPEHVQVSDLFTIIESMAGTIDRFKTAAGRGGENLKEELEEARRDCTNMTRELAREKANVERLIEHIGQHWQLAANAVEDFPEFAANINKEKARIPDMSDILRAMYDEIVKLRNGLNNEA